MIEFLHGKLEYKGVDFLIVEVGGVGFRVGASYRTIANAGNIGETTKIYTYMNVKEDEISLFGFSNREELGAFKMLISVSGVGPKVAIAVLSAITPSQFSMAVATGDHKTISAGKGVGTKLAQRIILELKDKINKEIKAGDTFTQDENDVPEVGYIDSDAVAALVVLGYSSKDASKTVKKVYRDGMTLEETVKQALKNLF